MYDSLWNFIYCFIFACSGSVLLRSLVVMLPYRRKKYPKGPWPIGFLGDVFTLLRLHSSPDQELLRLARQFGDICMLWYGSNPVIIINTPRAARDLLTEVFSLHSYDSSSDTLI